MYACIVSSTAQAKGTDDPCGAPNAVCTTRRGEGRTRLAHLLARNNDILVAGAGVHGIALLV